MVWLGYKVGTCQACGARAELYAYKSANGTVSVCNQCWGYCCDYSCRRTTDKSPRNLRHIRHIVRKRLGWGHGDKSEKAVEKRRWFP